MAEEQQPVRSVSWNEVFGFPHIFKSFKMAIHPSKVLLALLAIALTWVLGVFIMDPIWGVVSGSNRVQGGEAWGLWRAAGRSEFLQARKQWVQEGRARELEGLAGRYVEFVKLDKPAKEDFGAAYSAVKGAIVKDYEKRLKAADDRHAAEKEAIEKANRKDRREALEAAARTRLKARQDALKQHVAAAAELRQIRGGGICAGFLDWQSYCLSNALGAVRRGSFTAGLDRLYALRGTTTPKEYARGAVTNRVGFVEAEPALGEREQYGLLSWLLLMGWGLCWMFSAYPVYTVVYVLLALAVWAVLGGAICRIAALHAARDEKISMGAALRFSVSKFVSFLGAPLLPLAFIVILGFCLALGGLVGAIPYLGEWAFVLLFLLPLIAGAICAFLAIGLAGGAALMWPTIAVEGSDGFDAFSRSFSYIFTRPFRYGFYWLVAAVYGTICYLFVRLFAFIGLRMIHHWSGWAMGLAGRDEYALGAGKLDVMWARPTFGSFCGPAQWEAMNGSEAAASVILSLWVWLVSGIVLAFLASFLFSAATNIYFLLRRKVDATDLDDVYVEEAEEEAPPPAEPEPAAPAGAEQPPAEPKPPEPAPGEATQEEPD